VTNVTRTAQVARVTLWTDFSYPVYSFNLYLTGYDLQTLNVHDILNGRIVTSRFGSGAWVSPHGDFTEKNPDLDDADCGRIAKTIPDFQVARLQSAFFEGRVAAVPGSNQPGCNTVGNVHENAVGYITVDVVGNCDSTMPTDPKYFAEDLRWENALIGDYQQVNAGQNFAQASPMVHIRAIGENVRGRFTTTLNNTFYGRFQTTANPNADARQPLPATFAARWINGGIGSFQTSFKIWREPLTGTTNTCADYAKNGQIVMAESVVFDEDDNGEGVHFGEICTLLCPDDPRVILPSTSLTTIVDDGVFMQDILDWEHSGWVYLNLDTDDRQNADRKAQQGWVVVSMRSEGRYSVDIDAAILGNGCTEVSDVSAFSEGGDAEFLPGPARP
jgi:hypothetical protein